MKHFLAILPALAIGLVTPAGAQTPTAEIKTQYLATYEVLLGPAQMVGKRLVVPVTGGTLQGPKVKGEFVEPSGDWLIPMPDGTLRLDARESIKADDGEILFLELGGVVVTNKELLDRFSKGEVLTPKDEYFITAGTIATTSKKYDWLNHVQLIGKMISVQSTKARFDLFTVE